MTQQTLERKNRRDNWRSLPWLKVLKCVRNRCTQPSNRSYKFYGAKGIKCLLSKDDIAALWLRDKAWTINNPHLDRIDPKQNYSFKNCRFISAEENLKRRWDQNDLA